MRSLGVVLGIVAVLALGDPAAAQVPAQAKCATGKIKCGNNKVKGLLTCEGKAAKLGVATDPNCILKVTNKFDLTVLGAAKGCMTKLDAKALAPGSTTPCYSTGDAPDIEAKVDAFIADVKAELYTNPSSGINLCAAAKMKCVTNYVKGILGCHSKGIKLALAVDPNCILKVEGKFSGTTTACMEKNEAAGKPCSTAGMIGDAPAIKAKSDAFIDDLLCELDGTAPTGTQFSTTTAAGAGTCGVSRDGGAGGTVLANLDCGSAFSGGGTGQSDGSPTPDGGVTRYDAACSGATCALSATTPAGGAKTCSSLGCPYGPYRPQPNTSGGGATAACVLVSFTGSGSGSVNTCTGRATFNLPLQASILLTGGGGGATPCPFCVGDPDGSGPMTGTCQAVAYCANPGAACNDVGGGLNYECMPVGVPVGPIAISTPASSTDGASQDTGGTGLFCVPQANAGCFGEPTCDYVSVSGSPAGKLTPGAHAAVTGAVFCIPATGNALIDTNASFPGPGANTTTQTFQLLP